MMKKLRPFLDAVMIGRKSKISLAECRDSEGNLLAANDIGFADENLMTGKQNLDMWGFEEENEDYLSLDMEDVIPVFDEAGNFPIALKTKEGRLAYLKVSRKTGEVLPIHAGSCPVLSVIFIGAPSAGKTVHFLQLCDPAFHDMLARNTTCSFEDDLPSDAPRRRRYEEARVNFKNHILPPPNRRGEMILPYYFYVQYKEEGKARRALLKLEDIDGEQCTDMAWNSKIFQSRFFVITIGADEILSGERGEEVQYTRVVSQLLPRLKVLRQDGDYEVLVMITKSDCLDMENKHLKKGTENTVELQEGKWQQKVHDKGFDYEAYDRRSGCLRDYLKEECPNFYNKLVNAIPDKRLSFCMIASVGEECKEGRFENYKPFCIDEPVLSILAKEGLYPISVRGKRPEEVKAESAASDTRRKMQAFKGKFLDMMALGDVDWDDEEEEETEWEEIE